MDIILNVRFEEQLSTDELLMIDGGTFWGVVNGAFTVIGGVATAVGGVALLAVPEPTLVTKAAGGSAVFIGGAAIVGGIATIGTNL